MTTTTVWQVNHEKVERLNRKEIYQPNVSNVDQMDSEFVIAISFTFPSRCYIAQ
jgi:hypothetical protein